MKPLNYLVSGMVGLASLGIFGNVKGQEKDTTYLSNQKILVERQDTSNLNNQNKLGEAFGNALDRAIRMDTLIEVYNSMIPAYNQCIKNGTSKCEKIFIPKLTACDSLLKKFKSLPVAEDDYLSIEIGSAFDYGLVPFTDENANQLLNTNKKFYKSTQFLLNNPSQKNYDNWFQEMQSYKTSCGAVFNQ